MLITIYVFSFPLVSNIWDEFHWILFVFPFNVYNSLFHVYAFIGVRQL